MRHLKEPVFGLVKTAVDAHTLGISNVQKMIQDCGFRAYMGNGKIAQAVSRVAASNSLRVFKDWIIEHSISELGFSYRLDPETGVYLFGRLVYTIDQDKVLSPQKGGQIRNIFFAGLPEACVKVEREYKGRFQTFDGNETQIETLIAMGIPQDRIPKSLKEASAYDGIRLDFGRNLIAEEKQFDIHRFEDKHYPEYGTNRDNLWLRFSHAKRAHQLPLIRAHVGPYLPEREKALTLFSQWLKELRNEGLLDIVSIGSSQLSQSHFGEDWNGLPNGGGVPFNSEFELKSFFHEASPMLVRAYSGTKDIVSYAHMLDRTINNAWHALSLWWFNRLDGRGPLSIEEGLKEHFLALKYIASQGKSFEPNVSHHFAFRGTDDLAYIISAFISSKLAKQVGIRFLVLQNMLNTPKNIWGITDIAKARVMLRMVRSLQDRHFRVVHQPRAGLDYFSPDLEKAKAQLAAVTALMCDIEPDISTSPEIVHVVSYSEGSFLASPSIINDSIRITRAALMLYPRYRDMNDIRDIILSRELTEIEEEMYNDCCALLRDIERRIPNLYTPAGLYKLLKMGYLPVPQLWEGRDELQDAVDWETKLMEGRIQVVNENGLKMDITQRIERIAGKYEEDLL